jgi:hypothetical protein
MRLHTDVSTLERKTALLIVTENTENSTSCAACLF